MTISVFHWISDHDVLLGNIHKALNPQGVLVCEFGASGNIAAIENAFAEACNSLGYGYEAKFNFPTAEAFGELLKKNGFVIDRIYEYDRPTVLKDGEQGLVNWMKQFFASELSRNLESNDLEKQLYGKHIQGLIDEKAWERALHCMVFRNSVEPAFCVTFDADITNFLEQIKKAVCFAVALFGAVFALNMGEVRTRLQADSTAEIPEQSTDSNILIVYFAEVENSEVDMISSASEETAEDGRVLK